MGEQSEIAGHRGRCFVTFRDKVGEEGTDAILENFAGNQTGVRMGAGLGDRMFASAETDFQPGFGHWGGESGGWLCGCFLLEGETR